MTIKPFTINIDEKAVDDLKNRLRQTRLPQSFEANDWSRGIPKSYLQKVVEHWTKKYNWREHEKEINKYPQFIAEIDGQNIHFIHVTSEEANATPILLNHGYPGSIVEILPLIDRLTNPVAHGGSADQAFHVVVPSLPGFGFSSPVKDAGWNIAKTAGAYVQLMKELGYEKYGVQGSDIGAGICQQICLIDSEHVIGAHTSNDPTSLSLTGMLAMIPTEMLPEKEKSQVEEWKAYAEDGKGYLLLQSTRPETIGFALNDSPVGQLAWIFEKFYEWSNPSARLTDDTAKLDQLLTNVSLYWFTGSGASAAHFLYEAAHAAPNWGAVPTTPAGSAIFNNQSFIRMVLDPENKSLHWSEFDEGGHFPGLEVPELLAGDLRKFFFESLSK